MDEISSPGNGIRSRIEGGRLPEKMILRKVLFLGLSMVFLFMSGCQSTQWKPLISPIAVDINATINSQTGGGEVINPIDPDLKKNDILKYLLGLVTSGDCFLTLGAGDITQISKQLYQALKEKF